MVNGAPTFKQHHVRSSAVMLALVLDSPRVGCPGNMAGSKFVSGICWDVHLSFLGEIFANESTRQQQQQQQQVNLAKVQQMAAQFPSHPCG